jgi:NAD(P)-dependent dehydrogenase (short-subunit alcohol dehydrogenase family)
MSAGTVLITGGTGGLGQETARAVAGAGRGLTVVVTGRSAEGVERVAARLTAETGASVHGMVVDLGSLDEVRRFVQALTTAALPPLRGVVCNAGIQSVAGTVFTVDGYEQTFAVNHLAHFLLVRELLPHMVEPARIVLVASDTHDPSRPTGMPAPQYTAARALARAAGEEPGSATTVGRRRYTTSKLCNVLTAYELARRVQQDHPAGSITVNAFDPGLMPGTGLARDYGPLQAFAWTYLLPALTVVPGLNVHTPRRSATALARLVLDPGLEHVTGRYFSGTRQIRSSQESYDRSKQRDLWDASVELTRS